MIRNVLRAIGGFIVSQWHQYTAFGQFLFILALAAISVDAAISFEYGYSMTLWHGAGFALVAIAFAVLPDAASMEWSKGKRAGAAFIGLACIPLGVVGYQSHVGYGSGVRLGDMQQTGFHQAKYEAVSDGLKSERANLDMWRQQLADLKKRNAELLERNHGFAIVVDPIAVKEQIAAADKAIALETARGGCKAKCQALMEKKAELLSRKASLEQENDLTSRIEATQRLVDGKAKAVADTGVKPSTVVNQNEAFARLWKVYNGAKPEDAIKADAVTAQFVNIAITGAGSLAFMLLAPLLTFAAGRNRKPEFLGFGFHGSAPATPAASTGSVPAITVPASALATVQARRDRIASKLVGMRQSRIDGHLITAAA